MGRATHQPIGVMRLARARHSMHTSQQRRIPPRRSRIHRHRLLRAEAVKVVRPTGFGTRA